MNERPEMSEELELLAAEYALGLLEGAENLRATALAASSRSFASRVERWQSRGQDWLQEIEPVPVDGRVWQKLAPMFDSSHLEPAPPAVMAANDTLPDNSSNGSAAVTAWRHRAYAAIAASVVLAVSLGAVLSRGFDGLSGASGAEQIAVAGPSDGQSAGNDGLAIAQIANAEGAPLISAAFNPDAGALRLRVADFNSVDKAPELWVLDATGTPYSLGLMEGRELTVTIDPELQKMLVEGAIIAVTLEDRETAPHDAPTGDILGTGKLVIL